MAYFSFICMMERRYTYLIFLLFTLISDVLSTSKTYNGYSVFRVHNVTDENLIERLQGPYLDVWKHPTPKSMFYDVMVSPKYQKHVLKTLDENNIGYSLWIDNVASIIGDLNETNRRSRRKRNPRIFRFDEYHNYKSIVRWMRLFKRRNKDIVEILQVGTTYEGRRILALKIGVSKKDNSRKQIVWQDSLIHAREWVTGATLMWVANKLVQEYRNGNHEIVSFLEDLDWLILPVWNVDGYRHTWTKDRLWRKSRSDVGSFKCRGVDLNRNFFTPSRGVGSSSDYICSGVYHGIYSFSEPETFTVASYLKSLDLAAFITVHSYAQFWLYPYGYTYNKSTDHVELEGVARDAVRAITDMFGKQYTQGTVSDIAYKVSGGSVDWAHRFLCVKHSYGVELRDQGKYGFVLPPRYILDTSKEYFEALKVVARHVTRPDTNTRSSFCCSLNC